MPENFSLGVMSILALVGIRFVRYAVVFIASSQSDDFTLFSNIILLACSRRILFIRSATPLDSRVLAIFRNLRIPTSLQ
jgi:hypothetical protein